MGGSHWQKDRLVTYILFDLCLFKHFSMSQIFVISLYVQPNKPFSALEKQNQHSEIVIGHTISLKLFDHKLTETVLGITMVSQE